MLASESVARRACILDSAKRLQISCSRGLQGTGSPDSLSQYHGYGGTWKAPGNAEHQETGQEPSAPASSPGNFLENVVSSHFFFFKLERLLLNREICLFQHTGNQCISNNLTGHVLTTFSVVLNLGPRLVCRDLSVSSLRSRNI